MVQERLGPEAVVVAVFPDDNWRYLSTDLMREEPMRESYAAPRVRLLGLTTGQRVCPFGDGHP